MGSRDPVEANGELLVLRMDADRFTSLFGCEGGGVRLSGKTGVVEPE